MKTTMMRLDLYLYACLLCASVSVVKGNEGFVGVVSNGSLVMQSGTGQDIYLDGVHAASQAQRVEVLEATVDHLVSSLEHCCEYQRGVSADCSKTVKRPFKGSA
eukprot:m.169331 g.169331  ORF g.169331 m.169331 type:complete len:104 (-) comp14492_c2_seq1:1069-1380(-)